MEELLLLGFILYILERLVTGFSALAQIVADGAINALSAYVAITLFATRRLLEWVGEQLPAADIPDHWYWRMFITAVLFPLAPWLACRIIGIPTSWVWILPLAAHGLLWGILATEKHSVLDGGNGDDSFPLNL